MVESMERPQGDQVERAAATEARRRESRTRRRLMGVLSGSVPPPGATG
jgi:hypothetical protein